MAVNLARSFCYWHPRTDIRFVLATDQPELVPRDVVRHVEIRHLSPGELGDGFSPKLHLDALAPATRTLFIDADSLCVGPLDVCFERFFGHPVAVIASRISTGEWFGNVEALCRRFAVAELPKFNGGVYYLEPSAECTAIYNTARALEPHYEELGLVRLRGKPNEEILMAIALAVHEEWGIPEDGTLMAEPLNFACGMTLDVLEGRAVLRNTPGHRQYQPAWPLFEARPRIVHFLGSHTDELPYVAEAMRLEKVMGRRWPRWAADVLAMVTQTAPRTATLELKRFLRPAYHAVFGHRRVAPSSRL